MAKRKRSRRRALSAPGKRVHHRTKKTARRRRKKGMSDIPIIGALNLSNPLIGGAAGGIASALIESFIPDETIKKATATVMGVPASQVDSAVSDGNMGVAKIVMLGVAAWGAKKLGYPMVSAGLAGAAAVVGAQVSGMLGDETGQGGGFKKIRYANKNLLSENKIAFYDQGTGETYMLSESEALEITGGAMLSDSYRRFRDNGRNPYARYQNNY